MSEPAELLTCPQVARELGVADETVRAWVKDGKLPHIVLPSGMPRIRRETLDRLLSDGVPQ